MTTSTIPTWHHPHFVSADRHRYGVDLRFKEFTGGELEPKLPEDVNAAFRAAHDAALAVRDADPSDRNQKASSAILAAWREARDEAKAANTLWQVARFRRDATAKLRAAAPTVHAYHAARKAAEDAYEELRGTPDGWWQAKLLTLTEARAAALDAAQKLDDAGSGIAYIEHGLPFAVQEETPPLHQLAQDCGVDLGGWAPDSLDQYESYEPPTVVELRRLFSEQDKRITEVARLFGGGDR